MSRRGAWDYEVGDKWPNGRTVLAIEDKPVRAMCVSQSILPTQYSYQSSYDHRSKVQFRFCSNPDEISDGMDYTVVGKLNEYEVGSWYELLYKTVTTEVPVYKDKSDFFVEGGPIE